MNSEKPLSNSEINTSKESVNLSKEFIQKIENCNSADEKIRYCLDQMRLFLSQEKTPRFKEFWEIRKYCLPLFKESIPTFVRSSLWKEFIELTSEARRLKDILDDQASFTVEQIDLAISALEAELSNYDEIVESSMKLQPKKIPKAFLGNLDSLICMQREINILSNMIQRANSLRKELIETVMRVRFKNKFFKRLNNVKDVVFPKRKNLTNKLSDLFLEIVRSFYEGNFNSEISKTQFFFLKEEIKSVQAISKELTLSNKVFSEARSILSEAWDKLVSVEGDIKKEFKEKREFFHENKLKVLEKVDEITKKVDKLSYEQIDNEINEVLTFMRSVELGRDEVKDLKEKLKVIKAPFEEKKREEDDIRRKEEKEVLEKKKKALSDLKVEINEAQNTLNDVKDLSESIERFEQKVSEITLTKSEKQILDKELKPLKDLYSDLKEKELLASLSDDELKSLEKLKNLLNDRKLRKKIIKDQLEVYRKELGGSGFDFEKAMMIRELIDSEKLRLKKAEDGIAEIEQKISEIEGR